MLSLIGRVLGGTVAYFVDKKRQEEAQRLHEKECDEWMDRMNSRIAQNTQEFTNGFREAMIINRIKEGES